MNLNGHFTLNVVFLSSSSSTFTYLLIGTTVKAKPLNILRVRIFNSFGLYHQVKLTCFSRRRRTASMYSSTIKQLNKILTAYDLLPILTDCGIAQLIDCDSTRLSCCELGGQIVSKTFVVWATFPSVTLAKKFLYYTLNSKWAKRKSGNAGTPGPPLMLHCSVRSSRTVR